MDLLVYEQYSIDLFKKLLLLRARRFINFFRAVTFLTSVEIIVNQPQKNLKVAEVINTT